MLEHWFEQMLGLESAGAGEGTAWRLMAANPWAEWAALVFFLIALAFVWRFYLRPERTSWQWLRGAVETVGLLVPSALCWWLNFIWFIPLYLLCYVFLLAWLRNLKCSWTQVGLGAIRLAILCLVAFVMLPAWTLVVERTGLPFVVVMIDDSSSMGIIDRYDEDSLREIIAQRVKSAHAELTDTSRFNQAKSILLANNGQLLKTLADNYRLKVYYLSEAARPQEGDVGEIISSLPKLEAHGAASRLGAGMRTVLNDLRGTPPSAIILLTDGITTEGETLSEAATYAARKGVRLLPVGLGSEQPLRDLELHDLLVDEVVFKDDIVYFTASVSGQGFEGKQVEVKLHEAQKTDILARETVTIGPDGAPRTVRLPYRPTKVGDFDFVVEVAEQPKEANLENNRQQRRVSVREERIRVLLVQAYPSYEFRYLKPLLERDSTIEFGPRDNPNDLQDKGRGIVLQEADPDYVALDRSALAEFPVSREKLFWYDVVLFGDVNPAFLSQNVQEDLVAFVKEKGGGVIFFSGPEYTPMAYAASPLNELFPIHLAEAHVPPQGQNIAKGFRYQLTDLGRDSPHLQLGNSPEQTQKIWQNLPVGYWMVECDHLKPGARVLVEHAGKTGSNGRQLPIVVLQPVGAGMVLFHATDDTWRWRFQVGDVYLARYWIQAIRYLSRSKLYGKDKSAELTADRNKYRRGQPVRLRVRFLDPRTSPDSDEAVTVVIERGGQKQRQTLQRSPSSRADFEGTISDPVEGSYHVWLATPSLEGPAPAVDFVVEAPASEFQRTRLDSVDLKRAAADTRGKYFTFHTSSNLLDHIPAGRRVPVESLPPYPIWNQWPILATALGLLMLEWIVRKLKGML